MTHIRFSLAAIALALVLGACAGPSAPARTDTSTATAENTPFKKKPLMNGRGKLTSVSFERFFEMQQAGTAMIFDARPGFYYSLGHIPGAIHLPRSGNCDQKIHERESEIKDAIASGKTLVVYCSGIGCPDARTVAMHISGFGYPVSVFSGGWHAWQEAGMPTE